MRGCKGGEADVRDARLESGDDAAVCESRGVGAWVGGEGGCVSEGGGVDWDYGGGGVRYGAGALRGLRGGCFCRLLMRFCGG